MRAATHSIYLSRGDRQWYQPDSHASADAHPKADYQSFSAVVSFYVPATLAADLSGNQFTQSPVVVRWR